MLGLATSLRGGAVGVGKAASLLPPLATLAVATTTKQVSIALLTGIWSGCLLLNDFKPLVAFLRTFDKYIIDAVADPEHAAVLLFTFILGGTIALVQKGGGALGLAKLLKRFATDASSCLRTAALLACLIFFDDYSSILIVGNSFRPLVGMLGVCVEKFAFVCHTMGVCLSSMSPVSSWIGLEVGALSAACATIGSDALPDPFLLCMQSIPYRIFPLAMLAFVVALLTTDKDFGAMKKAMEQTPQKQASQQDEGSAIAPGPLDPLPSTPLRATNAIVPFMTIIIAAFSGMVIDGKNALTKMGTAGPHSLVAALSACDSVKALLWGSTLGGVVAVTLLLSQKIMNLGDAVTAFTEGMREVIEPCVVLSLAWALGSIIAATGTATFLASALTSGGLPAWGLAPLTSVLAYVISFATGSSFGTMGILFPLVGPLAWTLGGQSVPMLTHCFGAVLGGCIFGNVFSPIADTTVLTVLATRCTLPNHVATAAPYALLVGGLSLLVGDMSISLGLLGPVGALAAVVALQTAALSIFGRRPNKKDE
eukprot:CAMPEP_0185745058 /NCGR_PEP_ID=MMETSP1174-20130828/3358_1 /TAXON_ID=35687 /ORGANISM="Dictyocha speculum, Strain CCMP1381" /LENGTH=537 /DNA_ID=CAMNT_0028418849 /DNA_START=249 /DNA_END=1862 /DNA_ORIENTATION=-